MYESYDIKDWYWTESATGRVYSSKEQGYLSNPKNTMGIRHSWKPGISIARFQSMQTATNQRTNCAV